MGKETQLGRCQTQKDSWNELLIHCPLLCVRQLFIREITGSSLENSHIIIDTVVLYPIPPSYILQVDLFLKKTPKTYGWYNLLYSFQYFGHNKTNINLGIFIVNKLQYFR